MQRIQREGWQPITIESDACKHDIHEVNAPTEVGFVLWHKRYDGQLDLISSGHTFQGELAGTEEEPLWLASRTHNTMVELLSG